MGSTSSPCILVVTDEPLVRHMVARLLAGEGYTPLIAERGEADFGSLAGAPLALILVNTYLPEMSGSEAVERVRAAFPGVPVLHLEEALSGAESGAGAVDGLLESVRTLTTAERRAIQRPTTPN
jgi:DNA-binding response OmpR family regulator